MRMGRAWDPTTWSAVGLGGRRTENRPLIEFSAFPYWPDHSRQSAWDCAFDGADLSGLGDAAMIFGQGDAADHRGNLQPAGEEHDFRALPCGPGAVANVVDDV